MVVLGERPEGSPETVGGGDALNRCRYWFAGIVRVVSNRRCVCTKDGQCGR